MMIKKRDSLTPDILFGRSYPLGANFRFNGVNFSIYSKNARAVELLLFDDADDGKPSRIVRLDSQKNRTFYYWHVFVPGIQAGQLYGFRVDGPSDAAKGLRFDGKKLLLDPYTRSIAAGKNYDRQAAIRPGDNCAQAMKSVVVDPRGYHWGDDLPLRIDYSVSVIYELHVGGFTRNPNSGVGKEKRGTYAGLVEKIPYLQELGITAVELLPVQQFDEQDVPAPLKNYWGYNPVGFFAPHCGYSSRKDPLGAINEFRDMIKAFHRAGIEVILDVVFNHTAEGDHHGPTISFRGLENEAYYILNEDKSGYANFTGTGNSLNANHSVVRRLILDCLRYWVMEMHVDGFRFDLASVLSRDEKGQPMENPPILWTIESAPELAGTKIIAEAWDAAGLYQVGSFIGDRWAEWNGRFRDDMRQLVKGDPGMVPHAANRLQGSPDIFTNLDRDFNRSINFVTCHDGFTLNDLVSYNGKHNEANGEDNRDGAGENFSWNCGTEGRAEDPEITRLRTRQMKNLLTLLFLSQGTPMLLMGDEVGRTQKGNNNAYCQDNLTSWFDWHLVKQNEEMLRFMRMLIQFIQNRALFTEECFLKTSANKKHPYLMWHGIELNQPDWSWDSRSLACTLVHPGEEEKIHILINCYWEELTFALPVLSGKKSWVRIIDTVKPTPDDICRVPDAPAVTGKNYTTAPRSVVMFYAGNRAEK